VPAAPGATALHSALALFQLFLLLTLLLLLLPMLLLLQQCPQSLGENIMFIADF
jgi:hypothetical protein